MFSMPVLVLSFFSIFGMFVWHSPDLWLSVGHRRLASPPQLKLLTHSKSVIEVIAEPDDVDYEGYYYHTLSSVPRYSESRLEDPPGDLCDVSGPDVVEIIPPAPDLLEDLQDVSRPDVFRITSDPDGEETLVAAPDQALAICHNKDCSILPWIVFLMYVVSVVHLLYKVFLLFC